MEETIILLILNILQYYVSFTVIVFSFIKINIEVVRNTYTSMSTRLYPLTGGDENETKV